MNEQSKQLIRDNPNLCSSVISRFLGISGDSVIAFRRREGIKKKWSHKGIGAPYVFFDNDRFTWVVGRDKHKVSSKDKGKLVEMADYYTAIRDRL